MSKRAPRTSATIGLLVEPEASDGYYHLRAYPVFVGLTPDEMARIDSGKPIDYASLAGARPDRVRNIGDYDLVNGLYLHNLWTTSQGQNTDNPRHLYGFEVEYRNVYTVDRREAARMAKTLSTIDARLEKLTERFGRPATYGAYVLRIAHAIGASKMLFTRRTGRTGWSHDDHEYDIRDLASGADRLDGIVREWTQEQTQKEQTAS